VALGAALALSMTACAAPGGGASPNTNPAPTSQTEPAPQTSMPPSPLDILSATGWTDRVSLPGTNVSIWDVTDSGDGSTALVSGLFGEGDIAMIVGVNAATGQVMWGPKAMTELGGTANYPHTVCVVGANVVVSQGTVGDKNISFLIDAGTGAVKQKWTVDGTQVGDCAVSGDFMVQAFLSGETLRYVARAAIDPSQVAWQQELTGPDDLGDDDSYDPVIIGGTLVRMFDMETSKFGLYDIRTGQLAMKYGIDTMMVGPDVEHVLRLDFLDNGVDEVTRWDVRNDKSAWPNPVSGYWIGSSGTSDVVLMLEPDKATVMGVRASDGTQLWEAAAPASDLSARGPWDPINQATEKWSFVMDGPSESIYAMAGSNGAAAPRSWRGELLCFGSRVVIATDQANSALIGVDGASDDLTTLWSVPLPIPAMGEGWVQYQAIGGNVLAYSSEGEIWALVH